MHLQTDMAAWSIFMPLSQDFYVIVCIFQNVVSAELLIFIKMR